MSENKMSWIENVVNDTLNCYEFEEKLPGSKRMIKFRPSTPKHLKKFLQYENDNDFQKIENIIDSAILDSVIDEDFNIDNLYIQDRFFLFFCIRMRSKGSVIESKDTCTKCKSQYISKISFENVNFTELKDDIEPVLNINKDLSIELKLLTRKDQKEIFDFVKKMNVQNKKEELITIAYVSYAASIKSITYKNKVKEDLSLKDKLYFVENITEEVLKNIKQWNDDNDFGIDLDFEIVCPHCGDVRKIKIDTSDLL